METLPAPAPPPPKPILHPLLRAGLFLIAFVLIQAAITLVVSLTTWLSASGGLVASTELLLLIMVLTAPPVVAVTALFVRFLDRRGLASLGARWPRGGRREARREAVLVPLATLGFLGAWLAVLLAIPGVAVRLEGWSEEWIAGGPAWWPEGLPPALLLGLFLLGFLVQGGLEEWIVRGYVYRALKERWSPWVSALASSILFSLLHALNPDVSWIALVNIVLAGLLLAALVERSGSLWSATLAHGVWNFAVACLLSVPVSGLRTFHLLDLSVAGPEPVTGGGFGPEGSLVLTALAAALTAWLWRTRPSPERDTIEASAPVLPGEEGRLVACISDSETTAEPLGNPEGR